MKSLGTSLSDAYPQTLAKIIDTTQNPPNFVPVNTTTAPYSAKAVANSFLELAGGADVAAISPMKMQKLVFFAHGWYLANFDKPLVGEPIQAWQYGPVIESLYHDLKVYGSDPIRSYITSLSFNNEGFKSEQPKVTSDEVLNFLKEVYKVYGHYSAIQLSNLSHQPGSPWHRVKVECGGDLSQQSVPIPDSLIRDFFSKKL